MKGGFKEYQSLKSVEYEDKVPYFLPNLPDNHKSYEKLQEIIEKYNIRTKCKYKFEDIIIRKIKQGRLDKDIIDHDFKYILYNKDTFDENNSSPNNYMIDIGSAYSVKDVWCKAKFLFGWKVDSIIEDKQESDVYEINNEEKNTMTFSLLKTEIPEEEGEEGEYKEIFKIKCHRRSFYSPYEDGGRFKAVGYVDIEII
jgi:hypothetical protein